MDTTIKAIGDDRFGGYLVVWGNANQKDLTGEWFDKSTGGLMDFFKAVGKLPALYDHARDGKMQTTAIGVIDTLNPDDVGMWAEGQYARRNRYVEAIKDLVNKGALSWSSGALPQAAKRLATGQIVNWPIIEGSMTPMPAEPRNTHISELKSVQLAFKALDLPTDALPQEVDPQDAGKSVEDGSEDASHGVDNHSEQGVIEMDESQVKAIVDAALKQQADQAAASAKAAADLEAEINRRVDEKIAAAKPNGSSKSLPAPKNNDGNGRIQVTRATKYSRLSAQDMSFMNDLMLGTQMYTGKAWQPGEAFYRELADKSWQGVEKGTLPYEAIKGLIDKGYTKTDELDYSTQASYGDEWVPDSWRAELWLRTRQDNVVANKLTMLEMPTNPWELPIESTDPTVYTAPETTNQAQQALTSGNAITQSKAGTGKQTLTAKKLALRMAWSAELDEDSIIAVVDNYRRQAVRAMQNAIDNVCLNGDTETGATTNINVIEGTPGGTEKFMALNGFRKFCLVTNPTTALVRASGAPTLNLMRQTRFKLSGQYALQPQNCAFFVGNSTYAALLNFPEFLTMDKIGPQATALTGQVGVIDGVPVFATAELALSKTGLYSAGGGKIDATTAGNNTKGQAVCIFRPGWILGYRRQVTAVVEKIAWGDFFHLVVTARVALVNFDTGVASELYDVTV